MNRRTSAAVCLAASPLLVTLSHYLWPAHSEGTQTQQIHAAGAHPDAWTAATVVETVGWLLLLPALIAFWGHVRGRARVLIMVGVGLSVAGVFGYFGAGIMNLVTIDLGRRHRDAEMASLVHALKHDSALFWLLVAPLLLGTLALVLVFAGLSHAGWIGWWAPIGVLIALVASQALSGSENALLLTAAFAPMTAACLATARRLAAEATDSTPAQGRTPVHV